MRWTRARARSTAMAVATVTALAGLPAMAAPAGYPTEALADYVFGCMATNGETQEALRRCACSIDHIASQLTFDQYTQAETVLRMQQAPTGDPRMGMFRVSPWAAGMVDKLRAAQVEAEGQCF
jgi:hypothetical protein